MQHSFNANIAKQFDVDTAIFLQTLQFWTLKNLANKKHIHDGLCWTYNTLEALSDIFPYWSTRQIERVINNCLKNELISKGNYNSTPYDRTNWYALTHKCYWFFPELADEKYINLLYLSISPNGEMEKTEWGNHFPQTVGPIPVTLPVTKKITPPNPPEGECESFEEFWEMYPTKTAKKNCLAVWKKTKCESKARLIIEKLKIQIVSDDKWLRGFNPEPLTYLKGERWNDEIKKPNASQAAKENSYDHTDTSWINDISKDLF